MMLIVKKIDNILKFNNVKTKLENSSIISLINININR